MYPTCTDFFFAIFVGDTTVKVLKYYKKNHIKNPQKQNYEKKRNLYKTKAVSHFFTLHVYTKLQLLSQHSPGPGSNVVHMYE